MLEAPGVPCATRRVLGNFSWWFILHRAFPALPPSKVGLDLGMSLRGWPPGGGTEGGGEAHPQRERERERESVCVYACRGTGVKGKLDLSPCGNIRDLSI